MPQLTNMIPKERKIRLNFIFIFPRMESAKNLLKLGNRKEGGKFKGEAYLHLHFFLSKESQF